MSWGNGCRPDLNEHGFSESMAAGLAGRGICEGSPATGQMHGTTPASIRKPWSDPLLCIQPQGVGLTLRVPPSRIRGNRMFTHMLRREKLRLDKGQSSRFEHGNAAFLKRLKASWQDYRYEFDVRIIQPGLSRAAITEEGLHLLAGVETYLLETRAMKLRVLGSA